MAHCEREDCIHKKICYEVNTLPCRKDFVWYSGEGGCPHYNSTADVAPMAEVERLERILNSYTLQYGTVRDQQKVIDEAKRDVLEELEGCIAVHAYKSKSEDYADGMYDAIEWVGSKIDELKKKHTEDNE